jgi:hypothetical protein
MGRKESRRMSKIPPSARLREEIAAFLEQAETSESGHRRWVAVLCVSTVLLAIISPRSRNY